MLFDLAVYFDSPCDRFDTDVRGIRINFGNPKIFEIASVILDGGTLDRPHPSFMQDRYSIEYLDSRRRCNGVRPSKHGE